MEHLIKKCLKENPQERPTSSQVLLSVFISISVIDDTVRLLCYLKRNSRFSSVRGTVFSVLFSFSGKKTTMEYCLPLLPRINCSIQIYQPFIAAFCFSLFCSVMMIVQQSADYFIFFTGVMQKGLCCIMSAQIPHTVPCMWEEEQWRGSEIYCLLSHITVLFMWNFEACLNPTDLKNKKMKVKLLVEHCSLVTIYKLANNIQISRLAEIACLYSIKHCYPSLVIYLALYKPLLLPCACCGFLCRCMRFWILQSLSVWWGMFQYPALPQQSAW